MRTSAPVSLRSVDPSMRYSEGIATQSWLKYAAVESGGSGRRSSGSRVTITDDVMRDLSAASQPASSTHNAAMKRPLFSARVFNA